MSNRRKKTFTDDDLARTKREIPDGLNGYGFDSMYSFSVGDLQALVARLEAAEKVARLAAAGYGGIVLQDAIVAWNRSIVKESD
jgi:hypothetical protein